LGVRFDHFTGWLPAWDKEAASNPLAVWVGENVIRPSVAKNYPDLFPNGLNPFENLSFPEWSDAGVWNSIVPRFGLVYDLFGNGKTALKASYNRYSAYFLMEHYGGRHPFAPGRGWFQFYWTDTNANGQPDTSDIFDPFPVDFRYWDFEFAKRSLDPDTKSPIDEEITAGVWQEVVKDFSVGLNFLYRNSLNMLGQGVYDNASGEFWYNPDSSLGSKYWIPFTTTVPGTDEYPDQTVTAYFRSKDAPETFLRFTNIPELERKYWALELIFSKRYSQGWQLSGSIAYSKAYGNTLNQGQSAQYSSPNVFVNAYGRNDADRPLIIKLMGSVRLPLGIMFSGYFKHFSGEPWTRTASIRPPQSWANDNNVYWTGGYYETVNIEPLGSRRLRSVDILDIRFEKEFRVGDFGRLGAFIDVYNLLGWSNVNVGQNDVWRYTPSAPNVNEPQNVRLSPSYKVISSYEGLRSVNLSVRFRF